jgi:hypothetical protein
MKEVYYSWLKLEKPRGLNRAEQWGTNWDFSAAILWIQ